MRWKFFPARGWVVPCRANIRNTTGASKEKSKPPDGLVEDTIPEDQSFVLNTSLGLVVVTGCGHAGIVNILTFATSRYTDRPVHAIVGGLHLFPAKNDQVDWTADEFKQFKVANLLGAHCTGSEAVYRLRDRAYATARS